MSIVATVRDRLVSPRTALLANCGLVVTGSVLGLAGLVDLVTGAIVVAVGLVGIAVSLYGMRGL